MTSYFGDLGGVCAEKWAKLDRELTVAGVGTLVANDLATVRYLTGYLPYLTLSPSQGQVAVYVAGRGRPILYPLWFYEEFARRRFPWLEIRTLPRGADAIAAEVAAVHRAEARPGTRVGHTGLTPRIARALGALFPDGALSDADGLVATARAVKTPGELALLRDAIDVAEAGMREALAGLRPGRTELDVAADAERVMRRRGTESHAVVLRGPNAAFLQEVSTDDRFAAGDFALVDLGCYRRGYRAEFARSRIVGASLDPRRRALFEIVSRAVDAAAVLLRPGTACGAVARRADEVVRDAGYGEYAHPYPVGHGLGVTGFEHPHIVPESDVPLEENMVINLEPGIFIPDEGVAIRTEEIWWVRREGPEPLTTGVPRIE
jgi:Xaa-Pro aminopeptidase